MTAIATHLSSEPRRRQNAEGHSREPSEDGDRERGGQADGSSGGEQTWEDLQAWSSQARRRLPSHRWRWPLLLVGLSLVYAAWMFWSRFGDSALSLLDRPEPETTHAGLELQRRIDAAMIDFENMVRRQSRSPPQAEAEYRRRYKREPPPGFAQWVKVALEHNSTIIDEFDQLEADLMPFRTSGVVGAKLKQRIAQAKASTPGEMLGSVTIRQGRAVVFGPLVGTMSADTLERILEPVAPHMPDLTILFNWYAEPRVLGAASGEDRSQGVTFENVTAAGSWSTLRSACSDSGKGAAGGAGALAGGTGAPVHDVCGANADRLRTLHGFFVAPDTFIPTRSLVPLLSRAKVPRFQDILIPNPCYAHNDYRHFTSVDHRPFEKKRPVVYWRGTTTGIRLSMGTWYRGQRQRFVQYAQILRMAAQALAIEAKGKPTQRGSNALSMLLDRKMATAALRRLPGDVFDVRFSSFKGCSGRVCTLLQSYFHRTAWEDPMSATSRSQYVLDLDGQSMSCRFYQLLASNSVVIKQTIWAEWHSDRILPYVHYLPLSLELNELPMMLDWLLNTHEGRERAKRISELSASWTETTLRSIDISLYYYRVLLEYAALYNMPTSQASSATR